MGKGGLGNNCIDFSSFPDIFSGTKPSSTLHLYFPKLYKLYNLHFKKEFLFKEKRQTQNIFHFQHASLFAIQAPWD